ALMMNGRQCQLVTLAGLSRAGGDGCIDRARPSYWPRRTFRPAGQSDLPSTPQSGVTSKMSGAVGMGPLLEGGKSGLIEPCPLETSVVERSAYDMRSVDSRRARANRLIMAAAVVALACLKAPTAVVATTLPPGFVETNIASGLSAPTSFEFAPDGRIFVCQ